MSKQSFVNAFAKVNRTLKPSRTLLMLSRTRNFTTSRTSTSGVAAITKVERYPGLLYGSTPTNTTLMKTNG